MIIMSVITVCPQCGTPGIKVKSDAIENILNNESRVNLNRESAYSACISKDCNVAYFSVTEPINKRIIFQVKDTRVKLWYKDNGDDVPICYCSKLTRGEIKAAVLNGCITIEDVRDYTGKNTTGHCKKTQPLGKCCCDAFLYEIEKGIIK